MAAEKQNKGVGKGFAGLSSLVSDIDTIPPPTAKPTSTSSGLKPSAENHAATRSAQPKPQPTQQQSSQDINATPQRKVGFLLFLGILIFPYVFVWLLLRNGHSVSSRLLGFIWFAALLLPILFMEYGPQTTPEKATPTTAKSTPPQDSSYMLPKSDALSPRQKVRQQPSESKPNVGKALLLSLPQIRYCLSEDIRMEAAKSALNNYSDSDVDRYNAMVADYNSRCGSFRYRRGALESARRDVEPYRKLLQAEGRSWFDRSTAAGSLSSPAPTRPAPDATVRAIQQRLNELGYNAGPEDGLMGKRTRAAILAFQRDTGLDQDGIANAELLVQLKRLFVTPSNSRRSVQKPLGSKNIVSKPETNYSIEASVDKENYKKCIDGRYPALCDHTLLTQAEAARVDAAERKANFNKCIDGRYPASCDHALLTQAEAARVDAAERKANFNKCIDGRYPASCDHALLTQAEAVRVDAAERKANYNKCIDGRYPASCDHAKLTSRETMLVHDAERRAGKRH